jgi:hypothetical protein
MDIVGEIRRMTREAADQERKGQKPPQAPQS